MIKIIAEKLFFKDLFKMRKNHPSKIFFLNESKEWKIYLKKNLNIKIVKFFNTFKTLNENHFDMLIKHLLILPLPGF